MAGIDRRQGLWLLAGSIGLAALPFARARAATGGAGTLALVEKGAGGIGFYDAGTGRKLGTLALGVQPHEIVADPAGRFAYVGHYGVESWKAAGDGGHLVYVVDLARRALARTIDLAPYKRLHGVRMDARGRLYVLAETDSVLARFDDPATDTAPARLSRVGGVRSHYFVLRRDGTRAYVTDTLGGAVIAVDPEGVAPPLRRAIGTAPEAACLSADERTLYVVDRPAGIVHALDAATLEPRGRRAMRGEAVRVVTAGDGRLIVSNTADRSLTRLDPATLAEEARLPLPSAANGLNLPAGGTTLYASLADDRVAVIDLAAWRIASTFATGKAPDAAVLFGT